MSNNFIEDFKKAGAQQLDDELEQIRGGYDYEDFCWHDYCCYYVFRHPWDGDSYDACFRDYQCGFVYHHEPN